MGRIETSEANTRQSSASTSARLCPQKNLARLTLSTVVGDSVHHSLLVASLTMAVSAQDRRRPHHRRSLPASRAFADHWGPIRPGYRTPVKPVRDRLPGRSERKHCAISNRLADPPPRCPVTRVTEPDCFRPCPEQVARVMVGAYLLIPRGFRAIEQLARSAPSRDEGGRAADGPSRDRLG